METAMEQRNATATLASYGQDAGDFGPETDVDTPDEPIGLTKPKVEGEANIIDESGEDSEEDGGGWNYYNKSATEGTEKKTTYQENDNNTGNNSDTDDMDYKLNPDAPEFVPVSSPPPSTKNPAQQFLNMNSDDFISSSPQKFTESIDNVDVPDENDFNNEIKVHAADLSKFDNLNELNDDHTMLNGIKPLNEEVTGHVETIDNFTFQNEYITNSNNLDKYQNPFVSDEKVDLNKVQDLSEYLNDNAQTFNTDPYVSIMETPINNEFNSTSSNNELENESDIKLNDGFSMGEHIKYEQDMNSKNIDDTINTNNAVVDSNLQLNDESFKHSDDLKNDFMNNSHIDKFGQYEDQKLNDSVSTTDAILGSEPNTPMRMDNQSTFESENDDDQFSESFKQQLQFNQFDEHNNKENHDPFCFEQTDDPAGIIPNVTREINEEIDDSHNNDSVKPNDYAHENKVPELTEKLTKHEPVEEPLCVKEEAKPFHSVYEQQYLPESDFSASTHEALLNATKNESYNNESDMNNAHFEQHDIVESTEGIIEYQTINEQECKIPSHTNYVEQNDSDLDGGKCHAKDLKQEFSHNDISDIEQENNSINSVHIQSEHLISEHDVKVEHVNNFNQENYVDDDDIQSHVDILEHNQEFETVVKHTEDPIQEHNNVVKVIQQDAEELEDKHYDVAAVQDHGGDFQQENHSYDADIIPNNAENGTSYSYENHIDESAQSQIYGLKQEYNNYDENIEQKQHNVVEIINNHVEDIEQEHHDIVKIENNVDDFKQEHHNVIEVENDHIEDFKHEHGDIVEVENDHIEVFKQKHDDVEVERHHVEDFKQGHHDIEVENNHFEDNKKKYDNIAAESTEKHIEDIQQEQYNIESVQNHATDSDEEMHSSMIIHSDVENNMPQPYCLASDTLINEPDMMCTSMTFEENFQNRNMNDSLYVMETSSDFFGEDIQPTTQLDKSIDEPKIEEQSLNYNQLVEPINTKNEIATEAKSELVNELKIEKVNVETIESSQLLSQDSIEKQKESSKVAEIAVAAAIGTAAIAAVTGACLASKKSAPKKVETTVSKPKTSTTKTSAPILKKTTLSTSSKPLPRSTTVSSTSKPASNVRPTTVPKTTTLKATTIIKAAPKPASKTTTPASRPTSAKTTLTTPRSSLTKTTPTSSPKTPTTPKTPLATKPSTTPKISITPRTSTLVSKQPLSNGSPKALSRPISAPAKKPLSSATTNGNTKLTNGTTKLTNGDVSKTTTTKAPITLATRMSLAPPKLPPKLKVATPKTESPPAMPGPIRRPKVPTTKKTETA